MSYTLYGSLTSPFVRRIRMLMEHIPYEYKDFNIYEAQDALTLNKINPINQIPVLKDDNQIIWDSRQIFTYLNQRQKLQSLNWDDENQLTAIDGALNSGVSLLLMKRSGMQIDEPFMYVQRQKERIESVLDHLKPDLLGAALTRWDFQTMSIYSLLDWGTFRGLFSLEHRPECQKFLETHSTRSIVMKTAIPKA